MRRFLEVCAQIEETTALIYQEFARNQKCDPSLQRIWLKMARDEETHAQQLRLAMRLLRSDIADRVNDEGVNPDELNALAGGTLAKARKDDYEIAEMLKDAVLMENAFLNIHATYAIAFKDPSLLATFNHLACADKIHICDLNAYIMRHPSSELTSLCS